MAESIEPARSALREVSRELLARRNVLATGAMSQGGDNTTIINRIEHVFAAPGVTL